MDLNDGCDHMRTPHLRQVWMVNCLINIPIKKPNFCWGIFMMFFVKTFLSDDKGVI